EPDRALRQLLDLLRQILRLRRIDERARRVAIRRENKSCSSETCHRGDQKRHAPRRQSPARYLQTILHALSPDAIGFRGAVLLRWKSSCGGRWGRTPYGALSGGLKIGNVVDRKYYWINNGLNGHPNAASLLARSVGQSNAREMTRAGAVCALRTAAF